MSPARTNMSAIARSGVVHHQPPNRLIPLSLASHGMTRNCVSGPTRKAVKGEAIFSNDCPNPNTRHCRSRGTTFCMTVCSADSIIGENAIKKKKPTPTNQIDDTIGKMMHTVQMMRFPRRIVLTGLTPSPYLETSIPQAMNPVLVIASTTHQSSTETIESQYASMSAMNTPPRKLLNIAKNIIPKSPDMYCCRIKFTFTFH